MASSLVCKEVHEFHAIGKNPCYSSIPRRHTALQTAMSQKSLVDSTKKRATMQGSAEEKRCRSLVLKRSKKFDCNDAKNCARIQGFADRSESGVKKKFSASILKNIQPISVGV
ncbi:hypothetical protein [Delftia acidovorans]|uniref:hypothetical protein n=3 Tax=Delftia TaxID=80865 RepID=UPI0012FE1977|nr:hypothetical protein [Delftia acidovorans]